MDNSNSIRLWNIAVNGSSIIVFNLLLTFKAEWAGEIMDSFYTPGYILYFKD